MIEEYDVVELTEEIAPDLKIGTHGTVVMVYNASPPAFEVEFVDDRGKSLAVETVRGDQLRRIWTAPRMATKGSGIDRKTP